MARNWYPERWSIKTKSAALVAGYIIALLAVYGSFTGTLLNREAHLAENRLRQNAEVVAAEVDAYLEAGRQRLDTVSHLPGMTYGLRSMPEGSNAGRIPPWTTLHYLFFRSSVFTGGAFLVDRNGKLLWTEPPGRSWGSEQLSEHLAEVYAKGSSLVSPGLEATESIVAPHVLMAVPIRNPDGQIDGALGGIVDLNAPELTQPLQAVSPSEERFVDVIDQQERIIASNDASRRFQVGDLQSSDDWMLASVGLVRAPWRIVARQPRLLALADVTRFQRQLLLIGIGLLMIAVAVGAPIINRSVRDIGALTAAAETMASGDLSNPVRIRRRYDEIGMLARSLEQMRIELGDSRAALERRIEEREELIQLKEAFLANISHELRTPLNAIIGYNEMLGDTALSAEGREFVTLVRAQSEHLYRLLTDLLTLSGLNIGRLDFDISPVRMDVLVARLKPRSEQLARNKGIELAWECPALLPTIETDPLRLEQILTNLITNAVKFTERGRVTVGASFADATQQLRLQVSDTGIGIPAGELEHIFDEFRQLDGSVTSAYGGVGLGLALVKKLTELLHGEVSVSSEIGRGSTFVVVLPLHFEETSEIPSPSGRGRG